jgi:16S rRNA C967 or C1407 C5-methylase (RsmB/RsmF family)
MKNCFDEADLRRSLGRLPIEDAELAPLADAILAPHPPAIRLNTLGPAVGREDLPFAAEAVPWYSPPAFFCAPNARPAGHPFFAAGMYYVQDAASLLAVELLDPRPGELVCDLCAAPGGKATAVLERLGGAGWLLVNEAVRSRVPPLLLNLARHGSTRWVQTCLDPQELADATGPIFDAVLVDAPCTAQSLVGRSKQTRRAFDAKLIEHSAARQARILDAAVRLLRPGGRLVYSTCTFAWAENEGQVVGLLGRFPQLRPDRVAVRGLGEPDYCYRLWPHRHDCAGGFAARLVAEHPISANSVLSSELPGVWRGERGSRRPGMGPGHGRPTTNASWYGQAKLAHAARRNRVERHKRSPLSGRGRDATHAFADLSDEWGRWIQEIDIEARRDRVFGWPVGLPAKLYDVAEAGPEVAYLKGQTWFPAYALAMRRDGAFERRATVELEPAPARRFLAGEGIPGRNIGWAVLCYEGRPLGWAKGDGRILKNHIPKSVRTIIVPGT